MKLLLGTAISILVLACCAGCETNNCSSRQGSSANCGIGSGTVGGQSNSLGTDYPASANSVTTQPATSGSTTPSQVQGGATAPQFLGDLSPVSDSGSLYTNESAEVDGHYYTNSIILYMNPGPASVEYNLGRQWRKLDMTLGLRDDSADNQSEQFKLLADGRTIYTRIFALGQSQHVVVSVGNVLHLEMETTLVSPSYVGPVYAVWGSASLSS